MKKVGLLVVATLLGPIAASALVAQAVLAEELGTVRFAVRGAPVAQDHVIRGVKLLHHMMYLEADRAFKAAVEADADCALAYWGRAMSLIHPLWPDAPSESDRQQGAELVRRGLACSALTAREHDYLRALGSFFNPPAPKDYLTALQDLDAAWADVAERYPQDLDARAFSALYHLAPARFLPKDKSHRVQLEAAALLQSVLAEIPDHPGAQHYKIHAYDFPLLADRALEICDTYGSIAPAVPHALHMPTHIFTRRGLWEKSIEFNRRSADAARRLDTTTGMLSSHLPHALDYLAYAHLQRGQFAAVDAIRQELPSLRGPYQPGGLTQIAFAFAAIPARYALERQAWEEAAALPLRQPSTFPWDQRFRHCEAIVHYARALGAARSGRRNAAEAEIAQLERLRSELTRANRLSYWASQAETQLLAARAWLSLLEGETETALTLMHRAAETESSTDKEAVTPGEVLPAGDLWGDMLIETGRHQEALAAYEAVLAVSPNRLNTLYGAGFAAEKAGNLVMARHYYTKVAEVAAQADPGLIRVQHARDFLRNR